MLSKQFSLLSKSISVHSDPYKLNPWFVTGFIDAEGSFTVTVVKDSKRKLGWRVECKFQLGIHERDLPLLQQIREFFGGIGNIYKSGSLQMNNYIISSNEDLLILVNHLEKYPLLTQKGGYFLLFKKVVELVKNKAHLNIEGLHQIINIKASINLGLSEQLKSEFKNFSPVERPIIITENIPEPNWISGFTSGEGNFSIKLTKSSGRTGYRVQLKFRLVQHSRDKLLMQAISKYFNTGKIYKYSEKSALVLEIFNFSDISETILPFFEKYPVLGIKQLDYLDWYKVAKLMSEGRHLTSEGIILIRYIKEKMNRERST
jgi:hypothetical protein